MTFSGYFKISMTLFCLPIFHDFSMTFDDKIFFHTFPCFFMTVGTLINADEGGEGGRPK